MAKRRKRYAGTAKEHAQRAVSAAQEIRRGSKMVMGLIKGRECGSAYVALLGLIHTVGQYDTEKRSHDLMLVGNRYRSSTGVSQKVYRVTSAYRAACVRAK